MKRLLLGIFSAIITSGFAQISITSSNCPVSGDTARLSIANTADLTSPYCTPYTLTGTNFTWYFDSLKATDQVVRSFEPALNYGYFSTGFCEKTADSLNVFIATFNNVCDIYKKTSSMFYQDAWGITYMGFPLPVSYSDKDELYNFPLNFGDRDSTTFNMATPTSSAIPFSYRRNGYRITEADGWGTLKTPLGTVQCLRVVTTSYETDTIKMNIPLGTFTVPITLPIPNYTRKYQWLTHTDRVPYLEISGNLVLNTFLPNSVKFRDVKKNFVGIKEAVSDQLALNIYPNPASSNLNFIIPAQGKHSVQILDLQGRLMVEQIFTNNDPVNYNSIDISKLAPGIYAGRLNNGRAVQNFKFIKE
jgi:hypothetical protein